MSIRELPAGNLCEPSTYNNRQENETDERLGDVVPLGGFLDRCNHLSPRVSWRFGQMILREAILTPISTESGDDSNRKQTMSASVGMFGDRNMLRYERNARRSQVHLCFFFRLRSGSSSVGWLSNGTGRGGFFVIQVLVRFELKAET